MSVNSSTGPTPEHLADWEKQGYFIARNVISRDQAMQVRGVIRNHILTPDLEMRRDEYDPMDPMGDTPEARQARVRKLGKFCEKSPVIWHTIDANENLLQYPRHFLGDDLLMKFNSCFLKPARTGSATPWHQDNGLWRDGDRGSFNFWMAIDPATKANGCLQFIPNSHREEIIDHVLYEDSIHAELPEEKVEEMIAKHGLHHIELQPGDMVCWHSNLYHYSPINTSENSRIAVAGVYSNPAIANRPEARIKQYHWCMKDGQVCKAFPPELYTLDDRKVEPLPPPLKLSRRQSTAAA